MSKGNAEVLAHLSALREQVNRIEDKVDGKADKEDVARLEKKVDYTNGDVRKLKLWQAKLEGATSALAWRPDLIAGFLTAVIAALSTAIAIYFIHR